MQIHLVGGFLGSGKTTSIISAARHIMAEGQSVGIITNDQGKYLVDTGFFHSADLPTVEVTGGCFCCNYDDLNIRIDDLISSFSPSVIFAESVGSCADIVATVVRPLLQLRKAGLGPLSFSVFTDSRLLRLRLMDEVLPFSDDVLYIFDKQIEEANLLVINKIDLLSEIQLAEISRLVQEHYPDKKVIYQNALSKNGTKNWIDLLAAEKYQPVPTSPEIDYQRYGHGEAQLAWLDEQIQIDLSSTQTGRGIFIHFVTTLQTALHTSNAAIGHLKFLVHHDGNPYKLSIPTLVEPGLIDQIPEFHGNKINILINARVEMPAEQLRTLVHETLARCGIKWEERHTDAFHPPQPHPPYRIT